jgi:hypothetical protein
MSLIAYREKHRGDAADSRTGPWVSDNTSLRFLPDELAARCGKLLESFHAMHGYSALPDMLWHSDARDIIECHRDLTQVFRKACKSRCAKRANQSFLRLATAIVSLEVLIRDFAGWGQRYPAARREAELLLGEFLMAQRNWLMDKYLYPQFGIRDFASALASPGL